jgi:ribosome maturation factor RimP
VTEWASAHFLCFGVLEPRAGGAGWPLLAMTGDLPLERIRAAADRVAQSYGLDVFDVQLRRETPGLVLRVVIDRPLHRDEHGRVVVERPEDSIGIDDCERVSQDLSAILDVEDTSDSAYTLEVSSPGLDRPLRDLADYERFSGRLAKIVVREAVDGQMHFEGRLRGVEDDAVVLEVGRHRVARIRPENIARGKLAVEF